MHAFRAQLDENLNLTQWLAAGLKHLPGVALFSAPELSIVAFQWPPKGVIAWEQLDTLNRRLLEAIPRKQRVFLSGTTIRERFVFGTFTLAFRTQRERLEMPKADIRDVLFFPYSEV